MPIHGSSVISTQIQTFNDVLYSSLTDKENYCYTSSNTNILGGSETTTYLPKFRALSDSIVAYLDIDRNEIMMDLISTTFSYELLHILHNTNYSQFQNLNAELLFNIGGELSRIVGYDVSHYSDYNSILFQNIDMSISNIDSADKLEQTSIDSIMVDMVKTVKTHVLCATMDDIAPVTSSPSKRDIGNKIFGSAPGQLKYKQYNISLNFGLAVPDYVV